ncbi:MAG: hypothetical protein AAGN15_23835 [Cyanobacteria bacterium J06581_3]
MLSLKRINRTDLKSTEEQLPKDVDPQVRIRILVESAMEQSRFSDSDSDLVARELAGELLKIDAGLSDVRVAVQTLYQEDRAGAQAYLAYLAARGFPPPPPSADEPSEPTAEQTAPRQTAPEQLAIAQRQEITRHQLGQSAVGTQALSTIDLYSGNLIAELVTNSAYSALVFGERRSGTSAILRAIVYDQLGKSGQTILDILDLHSGKWGGLEEIRLSDGSQIVVYHTVAIHSDIAAIARKLSSVAAEVRRRQRDLNNPSLTAEKESVPYLFLIDGLSEIHGALPGWSADRRSKDETLSLAASQLRFVLCHGPAVGVSCVASARSHDSCLCDVAALGETRLLFLGRISKGHNGGYRAIDKAVEDKALLPSPHDRNRYREVLSAIKKLVCPVVFTPNGIPRLGKLANFSGYLHEDLLAHYQQTLEAQA